MREFSEPLLFQFPLWDTMTETKPVLKGQQNKDFNSLYGIPPLIL